MHSIQRTCSLVGRAVSEYIQIPSNHCSALDVPLLLPCFFHVCMHVHVYIEQMQSVCIFGHQLWWTEQVAYFLTAENGD